MSKKKKEVKPETIHAHNASLSKSSYVVLALLVPSMVFVATLATYFKNNYQNSVNTVSKSEVQAVNNERQKERVLVSIGDGVEVWAEIAEGELDRARGLSGRASLGEKEGMLFVFDAPAQPPFWMKGMLIDLDIIWISEGEVVQINENVPAEPGVALSDLRRYIPNDPVNFVLEVNAGFSERFGVDVGDKVEISTAP
jgi:uncharacterized membrane protein (UPF0127 family)